MLPQSHRRKESDPELDSDPLVRCTDPDPHQNVMDPQHCLWQQQSYSFNKHRTVPTVGSRDGTGTDIEAATGLKNYLAVNTVTVRTCLCRLLCNSSGDISRTRLICPAKF